MRARILVLLRALFTYPCGQLPNFSIQLDLTAAISLECVSSVGRIFGFLRFPLRSGLARRFNMTKCVALLKLLSEGHLGLEC